ncbi:MAG TPA: hypothetical protein PKX87_05280 [Alphaproteobacteria bacterium]|nr:hypothetical protein [Alphaproteobacteria bacterium]
MLHTSAQQPVPAPPLPAPVVAPDLARAMKIDVLVNEKGKAWVLYDRPFLTPIQWVEYDLDLDRLFFVLADGVVQDFGLTINAGMRKVLSRASQMCLIQFEGDKVADLGAVPLLVRHSALDLGKRV